MSLIILEGEELTAEAAWVGSSERRSEAVIDRVRHGLSF
jgi:hypothetical protein